MERLEELLAETLGRRPEERAGYLDEACAGDTELRREIEELIELNDEAEEFFDQLSGEIAGAAPLEIESAAGAQIRIGPYRTIAAIGRGGMGAVYRAERVDGEFDQEVALKLLHRDMDTPELRARFVAERQLLAGLSHPNIAHLLDGGVTEEGRPYFVMELIEGRPITRHCADEAVTTDEVLRHFLDVVDAVSYLHRNLVVHRDLKPSNIFVDGDGQVKLLDFGIAKLLAEVPDAEVATRTGQQLMTPEYAAPEQLLGQQVTTATDVYALGVLLYELLTGQRPHGGRRGNGAAPTEELPPTPSSVLRSREADDHPAGEPVSDRRIPRDLDAICLMALRPDPEARYRSAEQLGHDIENHLAGLPVRARKGTAGYRAGLFVRRHRVGLAVAAVVMALMVVGLVREASLRSQAEHARGEAQIEAAKAVAVSDFLGELLSSVDPKKAQGQEVAVVDVLDSAAGRIADDPELADQPAVEAAVRTTIGATYVSLGKYAEAREHLERAFELYGEWESGKPEALALAAELGALYHRLGLYDESETVLRRVLDTRIETLGEEHPESLKAINHLADLYFAQGRIDEVEPLDRKVLEIRRRVLGEDHPDTLRSLNALAATLFNRGRYADAAPLFEEALAIRRRELGNSHPDTLMLGNNLAATYTELGRYEEADVLMQEIVEARVRVLGEEHGETAMSFHNRGVNLAQLHRYEEAERWLRRAVAVRERLPGEGRSLLFSKSYLADVIRDQGRFEDAEGLYLETLEQQRDALGSEDGATLKTISGLAELRLRQGDLQAAEELTMEILDLQLRVRGEEHPDTLTTLTVLARIRNDQGRHEEALALAERAVAAGTRTLGEDHREVQKAIAERDRAEQVSKEG